MSALIYEYALCEAIRRKNTDMVKELIKTIAEFHPSFVLTDESWKAFIRIATKHFSDNCVEIIDVLLTFAKHNIPKIVIYKTYNRCTFKQIIHYYDPSKIPKLMYKSVTINTFYFTELLKLFPEHTWFVMEKCIIKRKLTSVNERILYKINLHNYIGSLSQDYILKELQFGTYAKIIQNALNINNRQLAIQKRAKIKTSRKKEKLIRFIPHQYKEILLAPVAVTMFNNICKTEVVYSADNIPFLDIDTHIKHMYKLLYLSDLHKILNIESGN